MCQGAEGTQRAVTRGKTEARSDPFTIPLMVPCVCVRGKGRNAPHRRRTECETSGVPKVSMDYFFLGSQEERADESPMLVMVDESTGNKYARVVDKRGIGRTMTWDG